MLALDFPILRAVAVSFKPPLREISQSDIAEAWVSSCATNSIVNDIGY